MVLQHNTELRNLSMAVLNRQRNCSINLLIQSKFQPHCLMFAQKKNLTVIFRLTNNISIKINFKEKQKEKETREMWGLTWLPRFLSRVLVNWFKAGGTFNLCLRILFFLWTWTTLGHFTKRVRSLFGGNAPPIPNCLGRFSNSGFTTFSCSHHKKIPSQSLYTP